MNIKRFEIEPIHKIGDLDPWEYGAKASQLRSLANLGLPVPEGFFLSTEVVNEASRNPTFKISNKFKSLDGLYVLRASPSDRDWGSIDAILNLGMNQDYVNKLELNIGRKAAFEVYRQFINNFSMFVFGLDSELFDYSDQKQMHLLDAVSYTHLTLPTKRIV